MFINLVTDPAVNWATAKTLGIARNPKSAAVYGFTSAALRLSSLAVFAFGTFVFVMSKNKATSESLVEMGIAIYDQEYIDRAHSELLNEMLLTLSKAAMIAIPVAGVSGFVFGKMVTNWLGYDLNWSEVVKLSLVRSVTGLVV
jgi:hypothetical protein